MIYVLSVLLLLSIILNVLQSIGLSNLTKKYEQLEDYNTEYSKFFDILHQQSSEVLRQLKSIDVRGSFEADDEVGVIYRGIRQLVLSLTNYFEAHDVTQEKN